MEPGDCRRRSCSRYRVAPGVGGGVQPPGAKECEVGRADLCDDCGRRRLSLGRMGGGASSPARRAFDSNRARDRILAADADRVAVLARSLSRAVVYAPLAMGCPGRAPVDFRAPPPALTARLPFFP